MGNTNMQNNALIISNQNSVKPTINMSKAFSVAIPRGNAVAILTAVMP
jgi:hypothetical protein